MKKNASNVFIIINIGRPIGLIVVLMVMFKIAFIFGEIMFVEFVIMDFL